MEHIPTVNIILTLISVFLVALGIYLMYAYSKNQKHREAYKGEYSRLSLVFPFKPGIGIKNDLLGFLLSVYFWGIGLIIIVAYAFLLYKNLPNTTEFMISFVAAGAIALGFSFMYTVILWFIDKKKREPLRFVPTLFLIGSISTFVATFANEFGENMLGIIWQNNTEIIAIALLAPLIEEIIKGIGVWVMSFHHEMKNMMDGILYGFIIGAGFSFIENWGYYVIYSPFDIGLEAWLSLVVLRTLGGGLFHGVFTALTGAMIGLIKSNSLNKKFLILSFLPAIFAHVIFNTITVLDKISNITNKEICGVLLVFVILLFGIFAYLVKDALEREKKERK